MLTHNIDQLSAKGLRRLPQRRGIYTCAIVGTGIAARALAPALVRAGLEVVAISGRDREAAERLASTVGAQAVELAAVSQLADLTFLAVRDDAVRPLATSLASDSKWTGRSVVHLAGRLDLDSMSPLRTVGALTGKMHPIASLAGGPDRLRGIAWGVQAGAELLPSLVDLVNRLGGRSVILDDVDLDLYHAAAVVASNLLVALLDAAAELWSASGAQVPAIQALMPLIDGTIRNIDELGTEDALTGPIVRGDVGGVATQLDILHREDPEVEQIYRALALRLLRLAAEGGHLSEGEVDRLRRILRDRASGEAMVE